MAYSPVTPERKANGERAEVVFREWLDESNVPYGYFNQKSWSFPRRLVEQMKRPDFLVGIIGLGSFAFDVKAKQMKADGFAVDEKEIIQLANFQRYFNTTVFYAFIPPEMEFKRCCLISNDQFLMHGDKRSGSQGEYRVTHGHAEDWLELGKHRFLDALRNQVELEAL